MLRNHSLHLGLNVLLLGALAGCGVNDGQLDQKEKVRSRSSALAVERATLDVNGDGYPDLAIGGQGAAIDVFYGGPSGLPAAPSMQLNAPSGIFRNLATAGDVNGDGYGDLVASTLAQTTGKVLVYLGGPQGLGSAPSQTINEPAPAEEFGFALAGGVDLQGDGYDDIVVSAIGYNGQRGRVLVYSGSAQGLGTAPVKTLSAGNEAMSHFGYALDVGDLNGDTYPEVVVSENRLGVTPSVGRVYIYWGSASAFVSNPPFPFIRPPKVLTCPAGSHQGFGVSVAIIGDANGDGIGDLAVGAYHVNQNDGRVYLYRGGPSLTGSLGLTPKTFSPAAGTQGYFGWAVRGGDIDGDGRADLLVGEPDANGMRGRAHVYSRLGSWFSLHGVLSGTHTGAGYLGTAIATADYDHDNKVDVVVGAPGANGAYLFRGSALTVNLPLSQTFQSSSISGYGATLSY